jgi:hypothetical protein
VADDGGCPIAGGSVSNRPFPVTRATTKTNARSNYVAAGVCLIFSVSNRAVCRIGTIVFILSVESVADIATSIAPETPAMMERLTSSSVLGQIDKCSNIQR